MARKHKIKEMDEIPGLHLPQFEIGDVIDTDEDTGVVFRKATVKGTPTTVLLKINPVDGDNPGILKGEYDILQRIHAKSKGTERVLSAYGYHEKDSGEVLALRETGGVSLWRYARAMDYTTDQINNVGPLIPIETILKVTEQVMEGLQMLHDANTIHRDINPSTITVNTTDKGISCQIVGFDIAQTIDDVGILPSSHAVGTPEYISPEQTGRLGKLLDGRSDYYSYGVVFWELLVGRVPFDSEDPMELIFAHLAKPIDSPSDRVEKIPRVIAEMVMKLLQKDATYRYQSTYGVRYDIHEFLQHIKFYKTDKELPQEVPLNLTQIADAFKHWDFKIGTRDASRTLCFSNKIYGRERESQMLSNLFRGVVHGSITGAFVCLEGPSGSGRSSFVQILETDIVANSGYLINAKGGHQDENSPFAGFISVLEQLLCFILAESEEKMDDWRNRLETELGPERLQIIANVLPALATVTSSVRTAEGAASKRVTHVIEIYKCIELFLQFFATSGHPVVLFFEDGVTSTQTIEIIKYLFKTAKLSHLMIICSIAEETKTQELDKAIHELKDSDMSSEFCHIRLGPLNLEALREMLADVIRPPLGDVRGLATILLKKTRGNPLHAVEFIKESAAKGFISFSSENAGWVWNLTNLENSTDIAENVADTLMSSISRLSEPCRNLLSAAAALGLTFDITVISEVIGIERTEAMSHLAPAIHAGYVTPVLGTSTTASRGLSASVLSFNSSNSKINPSGGGFHRHATSSVWGSYRFCHSRIHTTFLNCMTPLERSTIHYKIAIHLLDSSSSETVRDMVFDLVRMLNEAKDKIVTEDDQFSAARVFSIASNRSFLSNDTGRAIVYGDKAYEFIKNVSEVKLQDAPRLAIDAYVNILNIQSYKEGANVEEQAKMIEEAERKLHCKDNYQWVFARQTLCVAQNDFANVLKFGLHGLKLYGFDIPDSPQALMAAAKKECLEFDSVIGDRSVEQLTWDMKPASSELMGLESALSVTTYAARANGLAPLAFFLTAKSCIQAMQNGMSLTTIETFASSCRIFTGLLGFYKLERAKMLGDFVQANTLRLPAERVAAALYSLIIGYGFSLGYQDNLELATKAMARALDGYLPQGCPIILFLFKVCAEIPYGRSLETIKSIMPAFKANASRFKPEDFDDHEIVRALVDDFSRGILSETMVKAPRLPLVAVTLRFIRAYTSVFYDMPEQFDCTTAALESCSFLSGTWICVDAHFLRCIAIIRRMKQIADIPVELARMFEVSIGFVKMFVNFQNSGENKHKYYLVMAEHQAFLGNANQAGQYYEDAVEEAGKVGNLMFEAWAMELHATFWANNRVKLVARTLLEGSCRLWKQWGSDAKVNSILQKYQAFNLSKVKSELSSSGGLSSLSSRDTSMSLVQSPSKMSKQMDVDVTTLLEVARSISSEQNLDELIEKIVTHLMTNSGATKAVFYLNDDGNLHQQCVRLSGSDGENAASTKQPGEDEAPTSIVNLVLRTAQTLFFQDTPTDLTYRRDPYIDKCKPRSILCCPVQLQSSVIGVIYLENRIQSNAFTNTGIQVVKSLMVSAAIAIENARLMKKNKELAIALKNTQAVERAELGPKFQVDAPIRRVLDSIEMIKLRFDKTDPALAMLDSVVKTLTSDGLFSAGVEDISDVNGKGLDQDTKSWVEESLLQKSSVKGSVPGIRVSTTNENLTVLAAHGDALTDIPQHLAIGPINALTKFGTAEFDVFQLRDECQGKPLVHLAMKALHQYDLVNHFSMNRLQAWTFFEKIDVGYHQQPFHNSMHASDVLHTGCVLLTETALVQKFSKLELLAFVTACASHDLDHPAVNNIFLVSAGHPLAMLYNDAAVLEAHHVAKTFEILKQTGCNFLSCLSADQFKSVRKMIVSIIMATDLSQHFQYINKVKGKLAANSLKLDEDADRHLVLEMAVKCGDLGNPVKGNVETKKWAALIMEEFFRQGFIDVLVAPLYDVWNVINPTDYTALCLKNLTLNREYWTSMVDKSSACLEDVKIPIPAPLEGILNINIPPLTFGALPINGLKSPYITATAASVLLGSKRMADRRASQTATSLLSAKQPDESRSSNSPLSVNE